MCLVDSRIPRLRLVKDVSLYFRQNKLLQNLSLLSTSYNYIAQSPLFPVTSLRYFEVMIVSRVPSEFSTPHPPNLQVSHYKQGNKVDQRVSV
jgi:hypothetical protein